MCTEVLLHVAQAYHLPDCFAVVLALLLQEWIRRLRRQAGFTQEQFAEWIGVEPRSLQRWESGDRLPRNKYMQRMQRMERIQAYKQEFQEIQAMHMLTRLNDDISSQEEEYILIRARQKRLAEKLLVELTR